MSSAYDAELRALANQVAVQLGMKSVVHEGVYFCQAGPCFETVAELRMIKYVGGDVIGKSAVVYEWFSFRFAHHHSVTSCD